MADRTHIEWTDATWNPVTGCSVVSPGCANCYAMRLAGGRLRHHPSRAGLTQPSKAGPVWTGEVRFNEAELLKPLRWRRPRKIFVCAHGDLFHENVPDAWIDRVFAIMALCPQHTFQVLTKRTDRMRAYIDGPFTGDGVAARIAEATWTSAPTRKALPEPPCIVEVPVGPRDMNGEPEFGWRRFIKPDAWPLPNVWLGVSVEDQPRAARILDLLRTPAAVHFISAEPLIAALDLDVIVLRPDREWFSALTGHRINLDGPAGMIHIDVSMSGLDLVIVGGESGPHARDMDETWAYDLKSQCAKAGVAFFMKQMARKAPIPADLLVRQWPGEAAHD